jgi:hypothetical protein
MSGWIRFTDKKSEGGSSVELAEVNSDLSTHDNLRLSSLANLLASGASVSGHS